MIRKPILSSRMRSIGWEADTLEVEFNNGAVWQYSPVTEEQYKRLQTAHSPGAQINDIIRNPQITSQQIS